jgi:stage V sporulation protein B
MDKNKLKIWLGSQGLWQVILVTGGNLTVTVISAAALILLSRILGPAEFGLFSVGFSLLLIISRLSDLGFNIAVQKTLPLLAAQPEKAGAMFWFVLKIKTAVALGLTSLGLILGGGIADYFLHTNKVEIVYLAVLANFCVVFYEYLMAVLQSLQKFKAALVLNGLQSLTKLAGAVGLFLLPAKGALAALGLYGFAPFFAGLIGSRFLPKNFWKKFPPDKLLEGQIINIAKFSAVAIVVSALTDNLDTLLVQSFLNSYEAGLFAAAGRIASFLAITAYSIGTVLNPRVARYRHENHLANYLSKAWLLLILALIGGLLLIPAVPYLILFTAGRNYLPAVGCLKILLLSTTAVIMSAPFTAIFYALDKPVYFAVFGILQIATLVAADLILIPLLGINGAAAAKLLSNWLILALTITVAVGETRSLSHKVAPQKPTS